MNPTLSCGTVESNVHYLLYFPNFSNDRLTHFKNLRSNGDSILSKDGSNIPKEFLVKHSFSSIKDTFVLISTIEYIISI